jgi:hypothetical protein
MRAFDGQRSDNMAIKRTAPEKERLLRELRDQLAGMKSHASPVLRDAVKKRIADLEAELAARPAPAGRDRERDRERDARPPRR